MTWKQMRLQHVLVYVPVLESVGMPLSCQNMLDMDTWARMCATACRHTDNCFELLGQEDICV